MKHFYSFIFLFISTIAFAQIPSGYYDSATGTGYSLKTQLYNIINNNTNSASTSNYGDLWTLYDQTEFKDHYDDNDGTLVDLYTEIPSASDIYTFTTITDQCGNYNAEGDCYNREHVIPKSYFGGKNVYPMYSDAHFVFPSDGYINGQHASYPYGVVGSAISTSSNGTKLGSSLNSGYSAGYSGTVFEPIDEFKGDVARAYFYFVTRYEDQLSTFYSDYSASSEASVMFDGTTFPSLSSTFLNILLTWNNLDPVSQYEIDKNNATYTFQGNRNPFIDHPEYVANIWGTPLSTEAFLSLEVKLYPNPITGNFVYIKTNENITVQVFDILGKYILKKQLNSNNNKIDVSQLRQGMYLIKLVSDTGNITKKLIKQ